MIEKLIIQNNEGVSLNCEAYKKIIDYLLLEFEERLEDLKKIILPEKESLVIFVKNGFRKQYLKFSNTVQEFFNMLPKEQQETLLLFKKEFLKIYREYISYISLLKNKFFIKK